MIRLIVSKRLSIGCTRSAFYGFTVFDDQCPSYSLTSTIPIFSVLYFHRMGDATVSAGKGVENLQRFRQLCGFEEFDFYERLSFITTNWDMVSLSEGYARLKELRKHWAPMIKKGAKQHALKEPSEPNTRVVQDVVLAMINSGSRIPPLFMDRLGKAAQSALSHAVTFQSDDFVVLCVSPPHISRSLTNRVG